MTSPSPLGRSIIAAICAGAAGAMCLAAPQTKAPTADQLIAKVLDARETSGFRIRAKLVRTGPTADAKVTRQLLIRGRHDGAGTTVSYQVIWPKDAAGRAVVVKDNGDHHPTGFVYDGKTTSPLSKPALGAPLFDSDLRVEDVLENFWYWPTHALANEEVLDKRRCKWMEFRPEPTTPTAYSKVRVCVAQDLAVPLRIDLFGADGALAKQVTSDRLVRRDNHWLVGSVTVTPADHRTQTMLEGSQYEEDLQIPESEFTVDAIVNFGKTLGRGGWN